jgi:cytochrome c peroxidase
MKKSLLLSLSILSVVIIIQSCVKEDGPKLNETAPVLPSEVYNYSNLQLPHNVRPASSFNNFEFENNFPSFNSSGILDITDAGATLGRVLFYDKNLSLNNSIACASCHHQDKAFADGQSLSFGFEGNLTTRNSMSIVNPISQNNLFWDSRSFSIVDLSLKPVQNHIEMGMEDLSYLTSKLSNLSYYESLFEEAYGDKQITQERISKAMAQFVGSITTNKSKFDEGLNTNFENYTDLEKLGKNIFDSEKAQCGSCHSGNNFAADDSPGGEYGSSSFGEDNPQGTTNIGLDLVYADNGKNDGKFKIPSLRNIALTGPYMHDGRFNTLAEVIDHYSHGIKPHKDLDKKFKNINGDIVQLNLDPLEKQALIAFLHTLTDHEMIKDPKYSDPFNQ